MGAVQAKRSPKTSHTGGQECCRRQSKVGFGVDGLESVVLSLDHFFDLLKNDIYTWPILILVRDFGRLLDGDRRYRFNAKPNAGRRPEP